MNFSFLYRQESTLLHEFHISTDCNYIFLELCRISQIHSFLLVSTTNKTSLFVLSRLDWCKALFVHLPKHLLDKLQRTQNNSACNVYRRLLENDATAFLCDLHWQSVGAWVDYKMVTVLPVSSWPTITPVWRTEVLPSVGLFCLLGLPSCLSHASDWRPFGRPSFSFPVPTVSGADTQQQINHLLSIVTSIL